MYRISTTSQGKYLGIISNKSISISSISIAGTGITKIGIRKSIENNTGNLFFSLIKWYVLAFNNNMLSVFISSLKGHDR